MSILKEAFAFLFDKANLADSADKKVAIVPLPGGETEFLVVKATGQYEKMQQPAHSRDHCIHAVQEVDGLLRWARSIEGAKLVLWYDRDGAVLTIDDDGLRRHRVTLKLDQTDVWGRLLELDRSDRAMTHRDLMRLLRRDLSHWMDPEVSANVLNALKSLDFVAGANSTSTQTAQKQGFGAAIDADIRSKSGEIPEQIIVQVPVYRDPAFGNSRYAIKLSLECDVMAKSFTLKPLGDQMDLAWDEATAVLGNYLTSYAAGSEGQEPLAEVFFGTP